MNRLENASSPYLKQHAHQPVDWWPWGEAALAEAKRRDLPLLVSIGYSACHWCHVMAHESFDDHEVAEVMNANFVCIKIDREERPDVDHQYMDALHLMGKQGGWPLNCFALPDGRTFYGLTYAPKAGWLELCGDIAEAYRSRSEEVIEYAAKLALGIQQTNTLPAISTSTVFNKSTQETLDKLWASTASRFDASMGGFGMAPKFPMPSALGYLLAASQLQEEEKIRELAAAHLNLTLTTMAEGGIHDQIGGGFCRYSVDRLWHIPHFEKMLYDNGQLLTCYAQAASLGPNADYYRQVAERIVEFVERELCDEETGCYFSALDADSEGEEGKFYVWTLADLEAALPDETERELAAKAFGIAGEGSVAYWEHDNHNPVRAVEVEETELAPIRAKLFAYRAKRVRPGLDNKIILGWNACYLKGLVSLGQIAEAQQLWSNLQKHMQHPGKGWLRSIPFETPQTAFAEDYALLCDALWSLHQATQDHGLLKVIESLLAKAEALFWDENQGMYYFSEPAAGLYSRKLELADSVIPSPNSVLAEVLWKMGWICDKAEWRDRASAMLNRALPLIEKYGSHHGQWGRLALMMAQPTKQLVIVGPNAAAAGKAFTQGNTIESLFTILLTSPEPTEYPALLKGKGELDKTLEYLCIDFTCGLPKEYSA